MFIKFHNKDSGLPALVKLSSIDAYCQHHKDLTVIVVKGEVIRVECSILALEQIMQGEGYETEWEV